MKIKYFFSGLLLIAGLFSCKDTLLQDQPLEQNPTPTTDQSTNSDLKNATPTYYVSPSGNDNNPGTSDAPFQTIQKAADVVNPGDLVIIRDGVYTASGEMMVYMTRSGRSDAPITFKSEHRWGAVLDGNESSDGSSGTGYAFMLAGGASNIKFIDFEIKNFLFSGFFFNDHANPSANILIQGNKVHDMGRYPHADAGRGGGGIFLGPGTNYVSVDKNLFYNIGRTSESARQLNQDHVLYTGSYSAGESPAHHIKITYNVMYSISGNAIELRSTDDYVANNVIAWSNENGYGTGSPFIQTIDAVNETIVNNIFFQPPSGYAILNYGSAATFTVQNNMVYGGTMWVFHNSDNTAAMKGNNHGSDCELPEVNPMFVNASKSNLPNVDFSLQASSPAINAGIANGLSDDFNFKSFNGAPDLGAFEY
jgi:hypothetical protein